MTTKELEDYAQEIVETYGRPTGLKIGEASEYQNAGNTGERIAHKGVSWINYWRALTGIHATFLNCSCCDKVIFVGNPTPEQLRQHLPEGADIEAHRAHGGHINIEAPDKVTWSGGRYITPLCPACNEKRGQYILLKKDTILCQEVGATVSR